jgi:N utilization substance protein B
VTAKPGRDSAPEESSASGARGPRRGSARRRARELAFRVAYESDVNQDSVVSAWQRIRDEAPLSPDARALLDDVAQCLDHQGAELDAELGRAAEHWPLDRLAATDRAVLRAAAAELKARPGTPVRVVLDEAIELARRFGGDDSARFVNGVLDKMARALRPGELER